MSQEFNFVPKPLFFLFLFLVNLFPEVLKIIHAVKVKCRNHTNHASFELFHLVLVTIHFNDKSITQFVKKFHKNCSFFIFLKREKRERVILNHFRNFKDQIYIIDNSMTKL